MSEEQRSPTGSGIQAVIVYLGVSWVVMQFVDTLSSLLSLPAWLGTATVVILALGLPVVLATAWVQSLSSTTAAEEAGEVPTDWQVAPAEAMADLLSGKLPHLTWGRAIVGGVVAISLTIGAAGGYVLVNQGSEGAPGGGGTNSIAVLPFLVTGGAELDPLREGMVVLLSENLDGVGELRTVNHRTVLARWAEEGGESGRLDLEAQLRVASSAGARYAIAGSLVSIGDEARYNVDIHDLATEGQEVASAEGVGDPGNVFELVDGLSVDIARQILGNTDTESFEFRSLASVTTQSPEALREFLRGSAAFQQSEMNESAAALERAVALDSTFALAWVRLSEAIGWSGESDFTQGEALERAAALRDRLPEREAFLLEARRLFLNEDPRIKDELEAYLARYPADAQAWYLLGDAYFHWLSPADIDSVQVYFQRASSLDPARTAYWSHLVATATLRGDADAAQDALAQMERRSDGESPLLRIARSTVHLFFGSDEERSEALEDARTPEQFRGLGDSWVGVSDDLPREIEFWRAQVEAGAATDRLWIALMAAGRPRESIELMRETANPGLLANSVAGFELYWGVDLGAHDLLEGQRGRCQPGDLPCEVGRYNALYQHGVGAGHDDEVEEARTGLLRTAPQLLPFIPEGDPARLVVSRQLPAFIAFMEGDYQAVVDELLPLMDSTSQLSGGLDVIAVAADRLDQIDLAERLYLDGAYRGAGVGNRVVPRAGATLALARLLERAGRTEEALVHWRRMETMLAVAEEDFPPAQEVREAIARLGG